MGRSYCLHDRPPSTSSRAGCAGSAVGVSTIVSEIASAKRRRPSNRLAVRPTRSTVDQIATPFAENGTEPADSIRDRRRIDDVKKYSR